MFSPTEPLSPETSPAPSRSPSPVQPAVNIVGSPWTPNGNQIPQGFVLFTLSKANTSGPIYSGSNNNEGALVRRPDSYEAAAKAAFRFLGDLLGVTSVDDIVLKRAVQGQAGYGSAVYAAFDKEDWDTVIVGNTIEIGVFKAGKPIDATPAPVIYPAQPCYAPDSPYLAPTRAPRIYPDPSIMNWLNAKPVPPEPPVEPKSMQLTWASKDQMALVDVPPTYEALEKLAREVFKPTSTAPMTLRAPVRGGDGKPTKMLIHSGVYETAVVNFYGALQLYVEFGDEGEETKEGKLQNVDEFLMI